MMDEPGALTPERFSRPRAFPLGDPAQLVGNKDCV